MLSCSKCLLPETAEATSFDEAGSCSVCRQIEVRDTQIDWDDRYKQLQELVGQYRDKGLYGGASVFFDFENRRATRLSPLISSLYTLGYAYDCCAIAAQFYTFNVGARNENSFLFSFRLKGIGAFGTRAFD